MGQEYTVYPSIWKIQSLIEAAYFNERHVKLVLSYPQDYHRRSGLPFIACDVCVWVGGWVGVYIYIYIYIYIYLFIFILVHIIID